jgi:putative DNA primase/helicase
MTLIGMEGKTPKVKEWQKLKDGELHNVTNGNFGVVLGDKFVDIDFETMDGLEKYGKDNTFIYKAGRGHHAFYLVPEKNPVQAEQYYLDGNMSAELRTGQKCSVLPPSIHPNGSEYKSICTPEKLMVFDLDIHTARIKKMGLISESAFKEQLRADRGKLKRLMSPSIFKFAISKFDIRQVLSEIGVPSTNEKYVRCPFHTPSEEHPATLLINDDGTVKCFSSRCNFFGNAITLWAKAKGVKSIEAVKEMLKVRGIPYDVLENTPITDAEFGVKMAKIGDQLLRENRFATMVDTGEIYRYRDGVYVAHAEAYIASRIQELLRESQIVEDVRKNLISEIVAFIQRETYKERSEFDDDRELLACENGVLNVTTGELIPFTGEEMLMVKIPVKYEPEADCPKFRKFLTEVITEENIPLVEEMIGYCLFRDYNYHKAFMLVGEGKNGKSTLIKTIKAFLGMNNIISLSLQEIEESQFIKGNLYGKLANLYADLDQKALRTTGKFKMLVGGDNVTADRKFRDVFSFKNYAKMIFSANTFPKAPDDTEAFFRRWAIIPFPNKFMGASDNKNLITEFEKPEEMSGILNLAITGLKRLLVNGDFSAEQTTKDVRTLWIRNSDSVQAFWMDGIETSLEGKTGKLEVLNAYFDYCREQKLLAVSENTFFKDFRRVARFDERQEVVGGVRVRMYYGIRLTKSETTQGAQPTQGILTQSG